MITKIIKELRHLYDGHIAEHAQRMLEKHLEKVEAQEKPYMGSRIGFGATLRKPPNGSAG